MSKRQNDYGPSEEAVKQATGKSWAEWFKILDKHGAKDISHKDIASWLSENYGTDNKSETNGVSGWWAQSITVGYEYKIGRRIKGQTAEAGFEIGVQKTIPLNVEAVWDFLFSSQGLGLWLGEGAKRLELKKGAKYEARDGTKGEIRTFDHAQRLRLTWQPKGRSKPTTLQLYLECPRNTPNKTTLSFHQEKLASANEREKMRQHWQQVLESIFKAIG